MSLPFFSKLRNKKAYMRIVENELQKVRDTIDAQTEHFSPSMRDYMPGVQGERQDDSSGAGAAHSSGHRWH